MAALAAGEVAVAGEAAAAGDAVGGTVETGQIVGDRLAAGIGPVVVGHVLLHVAGEIPQPEGRTARRIQSHRGAAQRSLLGGVGSLGVPALAPGKGPTVAPGGGVLPFGLCRQADRAVGLSGHPGGIGVRRNWRHRVDGMIGRRPREGAVGPRRWTLGLGAGPHELQVFGVGDREPSDAVWRQFHRMGRCLLGDPVALDPDMGPGRGHLVHPGRRQADHRRAAGDVHQVG